MTMIGKLLAPLFGKGGRSDSGKCRLGWLSTWNAKCGIAEYSKFLLDEFDAARFDWTILASRNDKLLGRDEGRVNRCWTDRTGSAARLLAVLKAEKFDALVIQFNFGFLTLADLAAVIALCRTIGTRLLITFHSTADVMIEGQNVSLSAIADSLAQADGLLVHAPDDVARLKGFGLADNVVQFPHGYIDAPAIDQATSRRELGLPQEGVVIGSYGFCLPHKGIDQLIEAAALLHADGVKVRLLMVNALYPIPQSQELLDRCRQLARDRGLEGYVTLENRFLPNEISLRNLAACDMIVYGYQGTQESSSAAVRMGIAARRPVLCSPLPIFADVAEVVRFLPGIRPEDIRDGVKALLADEAGRLALLQRQDQWLHGHSWRRVAQILQDLLAPVPVTSGKETEG